MRAILLLLCACTLLCFGGCPPHDEHGYVLMNRRDHPLTIHIRDALECGDGVDLLDPDSYDIERTLRLDAQRKQSLYYLISSHAQDARAESSCSAVWLRVEDGPEVVLAWDSWPVWHRHASEVREHGIIFEGPAERITMHAPSSISVLPAPTF